MVTILLVDLHNHSYLNFFTCRWWGFFKFK